MAKTATTRIAAVKAWRAADARPKPRRKPAATPPKPRRERNCSVARTLDIVSDAWAFLIIREAFFGTPNIRGFSFRARHSASETLTDRLRKLTQLAIFARLRDRNSQPQRISSHQNGVRSLSELHSADAVWRCLAIRQKAAAADAHSCDLRL